MPHIINRRDLDFLLYEFLDAEGLCQQQKFGDHSRDVFDQMLDTAERLAEDVFQPIAALTDREEPRFENGEAVLPKETGDALKVFVENGFMGAGFDAEYGGLQLPYLVTQGIAAIFGAAAGGISGYAMLTGGAANLLIAHGSKEQIDRYARPMIEGRFFGTMCLSEPQAGSSLADIRTTAVDQGDGTWHLTGTKMWISGGAHDLSENIIHLVLARTPDAPAGVKGISLFIVPKFLVGEDGAPGPRNDITLAGLNHKMGNRATVNTLLNFGDNGGATAFLVGEEGQGLAAMFHMMNEARIGVGLGAASLAYTGYLHALAYAKDRPQGRPVGAKDPESPMVPIIQHADVKRMLLAQKAYAEGALALCLYGASLVDELALAETDDARERVHLLLEILTPICKSWPSEYGCRANDLAIQVHGGYGYTRDFPVERFYRDNRINPIHEGTKGIQGMDLLGRKVTMRNGAAAQALNAEIEKTVSTLEDDAGLGELARSLRDHWQRLMAVTMGMAGQAGEKGPAVYLANATLYLDAFGHAVVAWLWLRQAAMAQKGMASADGTTADFYRGKLQAARYFFRYELPTIRPVLDLLAQMDETCLETQEGWF